MQPNEMAVYLRCGLGRVVLFLREQEGGAIRFRDVITDAVLHDVRYDRQCEEHRAPYLYEVLQATGEPDWYADRLCDALQDSPAAEESDEEQRCELAGLLAQNGNEAARRALYAAFERSVRAGSPVGADAIISLDGAAGFQRVAQSYQDASLTDDDSVDWFTLDGLVERLGGEAEARQATGRMILDAPNLAPYLRRLWDDWDGIMKKCAERRTKLEPEPLTYEEIQIALDEAEVAKGGRPSRPLLFRRWGRTAPEETLLRLAGEIKNETAEERLRHLLLLFDRRPFPLAPDILLPLTLHPNRRVHFPAVQALSRTTHPDVRAQGLRLLQTGRAAEGIDLLVNNPEKSDLALFTELLQKPHEENGLHSTAISLREYAEANPSPDLLPVLLTLYEVGPCSMCRGSVVDLLIKANALPDAVRSECRYDADQSTREAVAAPSDEQ